MRSRTVAAVAAFALILPVFTLGILAAFDAAFAADDDALPGGLVETTGARLILLDVVVADEEGRPRAGLRADDFRILLNGTERPIYSVDDFCPVSPGDPDAEPASGGPAVIPPEIAMDMGLDPSTPLPAHSAEPLRYVLFFDFSQMGSNARARAFREAARWVRTVRREGDSVMIAGYASDIGIRRIYPFTTRPAALLEALEAAQNDPQLLDAFPHLQDVRLSECRDCTCEPPPIGAPIPDICTECERLCATWSVAQQEQGRRSLRALRTFLTDLDDVDGRKAMLFFHENRQPGSVPSGATLAAGGSTASDPGADEREVADPEAFSGESTGLGDGRRDPADTTTLAGVDPLDALGAEATYTRTTIYPAYAGPDAMVPGAGGGSFGARLAERTGGRANRGPGDLASLVDTAGREPGCVYRLGIEPPEGSAGGVYRAQVQVAGRALPYDYRVQYLSERDLWMRDALAALRHPETADALPVETAVVPVAAAKGRWDLSVEVSLDLDSLILIQGTGGRRADWEVGAILIHEDGRRSWQMLGVSRMRRGGNGPIQKTVVHRRRFDDLPSGTYRLAAFVRDRTANVFGASESLIDLPRPGRDEVVGPVIMLADRMHLVSGLPDFRKDATESSLASSVNLGAVPAGDEPVPPGADLQVSTWLCPRRSAESPGKALSTVAGGDGALWALEPGTTERAGRCFRVTDRIPVAELKPGRYTYRLHWASDRGEPRQVAEAAFGIEGGETAR